MNIISRIGYRVLIENIFTDFSISIPTIHKKSKTNNSIKIQLTIQFFFTKEKIQFFKLKTNEKYPFLHHISNEK